MMLFVCCLLVHLDHATLGQALAAQGEIQTECAGGVALDQMDLILVEPHDRTRAEGLVDLLPQVPTGRAAALGPHDGPEEAVVVVAASTRAGLPPPRELSLVSRKRR